MMDEETMKKIDDCHLALNDIERKIHILLRENLKLKIENEELKKQVASLVDLNEILSRKD